MRAVASARNMRITGLSMPEIVTGRVAAEDAVAEGLEIYHNQ